MLIPVLYNRKSSDSNRLEWLEERWLEHDSNRKWHDSIMTRIQIDSKHEHWLEYDSNLLPSESYYHDSTSINHHSKVRQMWSNWLAQLIADQKTTVAMECCQKHNRGTANLNGAISPNVRLSTERNKRICFPDPGRESCSPCKITLWCPTQMLQCQKQQS